MKRSALSTPTKVKVLYIVVHLYCNGCVRTHTHSAYLTSDLFSKILQLSLTGKHVQTKNRLLLYRRQVFSKTCSNLSHAVDDGFQEPLWCCHGTSRRKKNSLPFYTDMPSWIWRLLCCSILAIMMHISPVLWSLCGRLLHKRWEVPWTLSARARPVLIHLWDGVLWSVLLISLYGAAAL